MIYKCHFVEQLVGEGRARQVLLSCLGVYFFNKIYFKYNANGYLAFLCIFKDVFILKFLNRKIE